MVCKSSAADAITRFVEIVGDVQKGEHPSEVETCDAGADDADLF